MSLTAWPQRQTDALAPDGRLKIYVRGCARVPVESNADELAWWERNTSAYLGAFGHTSASAVLVWSLTLIDVERLCTIVPGSEPGTTWLSRLIAEGYKFEWSPAAIMWADQDWSLRA